MLDFVPGIQLFHKLQIEQTTPVETVVFFAVMVALFMLGAVGLYIVIMTAIWYLRFRRQNTPLHLVFLPTERQFREHAAEYLRATATSIILMFSLMAKHNTVEYLKTTLSDEILNKRVAFLEQAAQNTNALRQRIDQLAKQLIELTTRVNNYHQVIK